MSRTECHAMKLSGPLQLHLGHAIVYFRSITLIAIGLLTEICEYVGASKVKLVNPVCRGLGDRGRSFAFCVLIMTVMYACPPWAF